MRLQGLAGDYRWKTEGQSYEWNWFADDRRIAEMRREAGKFMVMYDYENFHVGKSSDPTNTLVGTKYVLYGDGHVSRL